MDKAKARQAPHNVAVLVLPECGAVPGDRAGCSWSRRAHTPVEGWEAERRDLKMFHKGQVESYRVLACPEFQEG